MPQRTLTQEAAALEQWLVSDALAVWWDRGADRVNGGFFEALDEAGQPVDLPRRLHVQARQVYVYANAGRFNWPGPWRDAVEHGLDYLARAFRRADGLYRASVDGRRRPLDDRPVLYGQAFVLLALAHAFSVFPERDELRTTALSLINTLRQTHRNTAGGFLEITDQRFQANANMHMLEAMLAWMPLSDDPVWTASADQIANLALARFIDPQGGFLREFFDGSWSPKAGDDGRLVEPGHQFEWVWLLEQWTRIRGGPAGLAVLEQLYAAGLRGIDPDRGVAINALWDDLSVRDADARLWPQTERIKAALTMARLDPASSPAHHNEAAKAAAGLRAYLVTPTRGLWRDKWLASGGFVSEPAPASSFYHIVCAILELKRAAEGGPAGR